MVKQARRLALAIAVALLVGSGIAAAQQQPTSVNPTASSVKEEQLLQQLQTVQGRITITDAKAAVLIQPGGRDWRDMQQVSLRWIGAIAILGMLGVLILFYMARGTIPISAQRSGRRVLRFGNFERFTHWLTAGCFIVLAVTGVNVTFGKALLMPLIGADAFAGWSQWAKYAHNYLAFPFMLGLILTFFMWVLDNIPTKLDVDWFRAGGGLVGKGHPPARKFNGGQKLIFWSVILGGVALSVTGLLLIFPFAGTTIADMQLAQIVHGIVAVVLVAVMLAHIYIGTIGMEGAFDAMSSGEVDENWAREHHVLWLEEERTKAPAGGQRAAGPAE